MKVGKIIGRVVCESRVESLEGATLLLVQPVDELLRDNGKPLVAVDTVKAGDGDLVMYEGGKEAAQSLSNWFNPIDAAIIGIVDQVSVGGLR